MRRAEKIFQRLFLQASEFVVMMRNHIKVNQILIIFLKKFALMKLSKTILLFYENFDGILQQNYHKI